MPDKSSAGRAFFWFLDWQFTGSNGELTDHGERLATGGSAELRIPEVQGEDMHLIAPLRVGRGYRLGMAYSVTDLRILKNYAGS